MANSLEAGRRHSLNLSKLGFVLGAVLILLLTQSTLRARRLNNVGITCLVQILGTEQKDNLQADNCARWFDGAHQIQPEKVRFVELSGWLDASQDQFSSAVAKWPISNRYENAWHLGLRNSLNGDVDRAIKWYLVAVEFAETGDAHYELAQLYDSAEQFSQAQSMYEQARQYELIKHGRSQVEFHYALSILSSNQPDRLKALDLLESAIQQDDYRASNFEYLSHFHRAKTLNEIGRNQEALAELESLVPRMASHYSSYVLLGTLYWDTEKNLEDATKYLQLAIEIDKSRPQASQAYERVLQESSANP